MLTTCFNTYYTEAANASSSQNWKSWGLLFRCWWCWLKQTMAKSISLRKTYSSFILGETEQSSLRCRTSLLNEIQGENQTLQWEFYYRLCATSVASSRGRIQFGSPCKLPSRGLQVPSVHPYLVKAPPAHHPKSATCQLSIIFESLFQKLRSA